VRSQCAHAPARSGSATPKAPQEEHRGMYTIFAARAGAGLCSRGRAALMNA
jgi:hypothetical protein